MAKKENESSALKKLFNSIDQIYSDSDVNLYDDDSDMGAFQTFEQKKRDKKITLLLTHYVNWYEDKAKDNRLFKQVIFYSMIGALGLIVFTCIAMSMISLFKQNQSTADVITLISSFVTLAVAIIGIVNVITAHIFPQDDEKYITQIVESIQRNDLENKRENIKANQNSNKNTDED